MILLTSIVDYRLDAISLYSSTSVRSARMPLRRMRHTSARKLERIACGTARARAREADGATGRFEHARLR
jgi:hypothetical protein